MPEDNYLTIQKYRGTTPKRTRLEIDGTGITTRSFRDGKTYNIGNVREDPDYVEAYSAVLSELAVPIIVGDKVRGIVNVEADRLDAYSAEDVSLVETLTLHIASALERINSREQQENMFQQLLNEQLKLEQSIKTSDLKTRFLSNASHEFKTPLTSIVGYVGLIRMFKDMSNPGDVDEYLNIIEKNALRLGRLSTDLTEMQMIEIGRMDIAKKPVDIDGWIDEVRGEIKPILDKKAQTLNYLRNVERTSVIGDKTRLSQVMINLLSNASKFSPNGSAISLDVSGTNDEVVFSVKDEGAGLAHEDIGKLFAPFPDIAKDSDIESTGLGLSICKGIVELHDGKIWAESEGIGKGSTFSFTVPCS